MEQIILQAKVSCLDALQDFIGVHMRNAGIAESCQNKILVAAEEIFVNAARYAYPSGDGNVTIRAAVEPERVVLEFRDSGKPFNPLSKSLPDLSVPAQAREIGGLGIHMVKNLMDDMCYEYRDGQNILTILKNK